MKALSSDHPPLDQLRDFNSGRLDEAAQAAVAAHVAGCPACCERLERLAEDDPLLGRLREAEEARRAGGLFGEDVPTQPGTPGERPRQATAALPTVPGYELLGEVGRGGMGVVYKARQLRLNRVVALKMLQDAGLADPRRLLRFQLEGEITARVRHPNVVETFEVGALGGRPYLVLEWVDGGTLGQFLGGRSLPPREAALLAETLARAVHAAHRQGVLHRDLKPANVLRTADGVLKVTDFGVAKDLRSEAHLTETGLVAGTPQYMAPEQVAGAKGEVGPATDVYALGVLLYEMLTGRTPFELGDPLSFLRQVCEEEPLPPPGASGPGCRPTWRRCA
jgi:serine/threonine-protein kinase